MEDFELTVFNELVSAIPDIEFSMQNYNIEYKGDDIAIFHTLGPVPIRYVEFNEPHVWEFTFLVDIFTGGDGSIRRGQLLGQQISAIMIENGIKLRNSVRLPHLEGKDVTRTTNTYVARVTKDLMVY